MKNPIVPILGIFALAHSSPGAPVTWEPPTPTIDENSISLQGSFIHAGTWGNGDGAGPISVPVGAETIIFNNAATGTVIDGNNAVATAGGIFYDSNAWIPAGSANANFQRVMDGFAYDGGNPKVIILGGLVAGSTYQVQLFTSDDRECCGGRTQKWSDQASNGTGNETLPYTMNSSSHVIGTFVADGPTQTFYARGVAQDSNAVSAYVLRLLQAPDADSDGIPDDYEDARPQILDKNDPTDAGENPDNDGLTNLQEYQQRTDPENPDTDGDGLTDGQEVNAPANSTSSPLLVDTDGDGLSDFAERMTHNSNPRNPDSDGDHFSDAYEAQAGSSLISASSTPNGTTLSILGTNTASLLTSDLTDPTNNGNDTVPQGLNFDWLGITSSNRSHFQVAAENNGSGAFDVFDNKVGNGEEKWCCDGVPLGGQQDVTVEFDEEVSLTHFTIASSGDSPQRDPRVWEIQGSNDGQNFAPITRFDFASQQIWTERNQVIRVNLPTASLPYRFIRYAVYRTGSTEHALNEIEYFGSKVGTDTDNDGMPDFYENRYSAFLNDENGADATDDEDGDGLSNIEEFVAGTRPDLADSDNDGLNDRRELVELGTNPNNRDTDQDGLTDGQEVIQYGSNPTSQDSDGDRFRDGYEVSNGGDPANPNVGPGAKLTSLGTGTSALLDRDVTDHDNDGVEGTDANNAQFDWVNITASAKPFFHNFGGNEGAFDLFDNKVGGGETKFFNDSAPVTVTLELPYTVALKYFTLASADDSPNRDPRVWSISGSTDGTSFSPIFAMNDTEASLWGDRRQEVLRFDLTTTAPAYKYFRFTTTATGGTQFQLSEIELFGIEQDTDNDGMSDFFEAQYNYDPLDPLDGLDDSDGDGLTNAEEYQFGGNPGDPDSDDDGLNDLEEKNAGSRLDLADTDGDGFSDLTEVTYGSSPTNAGEIPDFAPILWGSPTNITGNISDFKTNGTLVHAWAGGNSVMIDALGINFQTGPLLADRYNDFDPYTRPGGDAQYETLLNGGSYGSSDFIEIPGLVIGRTYQVQIWVADTRECCSGRDYNFGTYDPEDPSVNLNSGSFIAPASNSGQYVVGTFTAEQVNQFIYVTNGTGGSQYNAIMIRQLPDDENGPKVTATGFNGTAFQITVANLDTTKTYRLRRSINLVTFANLGDPFVPTAAQQVLTDSAPPQGKAFYQVVEVSP